MAFAQDENRLSPYRKFLLDLSSHLSGRDLEALKFAALEFIPRRITENISSGLKFFDVLEQDGRITPQDLSLLVDMFKAVGRMDLAWKVQCFSTSCANNDIPGESRKEQEQGAISTSSNEHAPASPFSSIPIQHSTTSQQTPGIHPPSFVSQAVPSPSFTQHIPAIPSPSLTQHPTSQHIPAIPSPSFTQHLTSQHIPAIPSPSFTQHTTTSQHTPAFQSPSLRTQHTTTSEHTSAAQSQASSHPITSVENRPLVAYMRGKQLLASGYPIPERRQIHGQGVPPSFICVELTFAEPNTPSPCILGDKEENRFLVAGAYFALPLKDLFVSI